MSDDLGPAAYQGGALLMLLIAGILFLSWFVAAALTENWRERVRYFCGVSTGLALFAAALMFVASLI